MRKTILFGALATLIGLGAVAQANDKAGDRATDRARDTIEMTAQGTQLAVNDRDGFKADREARGNREHADRDEAGEKHREARREKHNDFGGAEGREHQRR